jgi:hypothetical protein
VNEPSEWQARHRRFDDVQRALHAQGKQAP